MSLEPTPVIEAYKRDVDRTLLRENSKLTTAQRIEKMIAARDAPLVDRPPVRREEQCGTRGGGSRVRVRSWTTIVRVAARGDDAEMDARAIATGLVLVSCNADNRDDSPFSGSATAASTMPATNATSDTSESEGEGDGSAGSSSTGGSSGGSTTSGSSGGSGGTTVADSSGGASMTDPSATMTASTSMGGDVCDEFCNGCACPSDQCTMCCAMRDMVDACQGGMCTCF